MHSINDVTVVVVTYNSEHVIERCITSVPTECEVVIVDNASSDDTLNRATGKHPRLRVIENRVNRGFGRANNQGLAATGSAMVLFLNPDAFLTPGAVETLLGAAHSFSDAALFGPAIQNTHGVTIETFGANRLFRRRPTVQPIPEGCCCVEFLLGAALLGHTEEMRALGGFDEAIFLFYEDDDLCLRVRKAGRSIVYVPGAVVTHLYGMSSAAAPSLLAFKAWHMAWSRLYLVAKHRGRFAMLKEAFIRLAYSCARVPLSLRFGGASAREEHLARIRGAIAFLRGRVSST
jgi:N-acetylglucosaminyl-diphospho-decaprenol L-rhamnosyltransferase